MLLLARRPTPALRHVGMAAVRSASRMTRESSPSHPSEPKEVLHPKLVHLSSWVSDAPGILPADTRAEIDAQINKLHDTTGAQVAVVLLEDIAGRPTLSQYEAFSVGLFDLWGVGRKDHDDGVLLALFREGRRILSLIHI